MSPPGGTASEATLDARGAAPTLLPGGARVGRHFVLGLVGMGGMGAVYSAYDPDLDRKIAIKVLRPRGDDTAARARSQERFLREAQAMARLSHPNVLAIY